MVPGEPQGCVAQRGVFGLLGTSEAAPAQGIPNSWAAARGRVKSPGGLPGGGGGGLSATQVRAGELGPVGRHPAHSTSVIRTACRTWRPAQKRRGDRGAKSTPTLGGALTGLELEMDSSTFVPDPSFL